MDLNKIELLASDGERDFLLDLYSTSRSHEVAGFGWDPPAIRSFLSTQFDAREKVYKLQFPHAEDRVISVGSVKAGRIFVDRSPSDIHLIDIAILPEFRMQGIATALIMSLLSEARERSCPVSLKVDKSSNDAISVYRKTGFKITSESQLMLEMKWMADQSQGSGEITLRSTDASDRELLVKIYEASRETELAMTNWGAEQRRSFAELQLEGQSRHYKEYFPKAVHSIVLKGDDEVGRLYVDRGENEIAILDMTILPQFRRSGIATRLVDELQKEAKATGRSLRVFVESFNPSRSFFSRLGFKATSQQGINIKMEWNN